MSSIPPPPRERHVRLAGTRNLRDVGGYPAGDGRQTRWQTLFRGDALDRLPVASQAALLALDLRLAVDLRWPTEVASAPSVFRDSPGVRYVNLPLRDPNPSPVSGLPGAYRRIVDDRGAQLAGVVGAILEQDGLPAIVTCAAGVDRTGLAIAIVLAAIGVSDDIIAADYALSVASFEGDGRAAGLDDWRSGPIAIDARPSTIVATLGYLRRRHGGVTGFLAAHGVAEDDVSRLRDLLTEAIPAVDR